MSTIEVALSGPRRWRNLLAHPAAIFVLLSTLFGSIIVAITAPLRGPDEAAHFLRAYGMAQGDIIPSQADAEARKGVILPARLHRDFAFFEAAYAKERRAHWSSEAIAENRRRRTEGRVDSGDPASVFAGYEGSEGYTPVAYVPYVAAAFVARLADLDFVTTLYLMRLTGFAAMTAIVAYAVAIVPYFRWAFLCIAMLPAALYGRAVISADGGAVACAMMVTALTLRSAAHAGTGLRSHHALWMMLAALSKPPTLAYVLLEAMRWPFRDLPRHWRTIAIIVLPGVVAMLAWTIATSGDVAAWRVVELTGNAPKQFDPAWKLGFMVDHPLHFPAAVMGTFKDTTELWRQLIGVLGLFDTVLQLWTYPAISILLVVACLTPVELSFATRHWIAAVAGMTAAAYCLAVFLIFYLISTPTDADQVWGVQGRYFIPAVPLFAVVFSCLVNRGLGEQTRASVAIGGATLSGVASIEAILRVDSHIWGA